METIIIEIKVYFIKILFTSYNGYNNICKVIIGRINDDKILFL